MNNLILHPQTEHSIDQLIVTETHAIMLTGNEGSGKRFVARTIAEALLAGSLENHPYFIHLEPAGKSFTIDQIRELQKSMKLKTTGSKTIRRVAILQDVHTMTTEAQNALLKLLEEPPDDTILLLTAQGDSSMKPTIYSRVQRVHLKPVAIEHLPKNISEHKDISKLHSLSGGDIGLLLALIEGKTEHPLVGAISDAKTLITSPVFIRLTRVDELGKDKEKLKSILMAMKRIASATLRASTLKGDTKNRERWTRILEKTYATEYMLQTNVNPKLVLTELFLAF